MDLRPMTQSEFEQYFTRAVPEYAASKVTAGIHSAQDAERLAREEIEGLVPEGLATPGQLLFTAVDGGTAVGILWLALPAQGRPQAWIYDIEVDEVHRGRGYGRAIMLAAERELAARGMHELGLNVFGYNTAAIRLYESLGYEVTAQQMSKTF
jgi:ribosomal protein S18 acetylase RimI-like enzyme